MKPKVRPGHVYENEATGGVYLVLGRDDPEDTWRCVVLVVDVLWPNDPPGTITSCLDRWLKTACKRLS